MRFEYPKFIYNYPFLEKQQDYEHPVWYPHEDKPEDWSHLDISKRQDHINCLNGERQAVFNLMNYMKQNGWIISAIDNGEERIEVANSEMTDREVMEHIFSVDDSYMYFIAPDKEEHWVYFVFGNSPEEVICDHSDTKDGFSELVSAFYMED
jgi:hypothetical protein